jgi:hypothetical protein
MFTILAANNLHYIGGGNSINIFHSAARFTVALAPITVHAIIAKLFYRRLPDDTVSRHCYPSKKQHSILDGRPMLYL